MRVGLGTGSTSEEMVRALAAGGWRWRPWVPTSARILGLARELGLPVAAEYPDFAPLDIAIDGADEVDPQGGLVKGGGGALLREKLVAASAACFVVMVDRSKHVERLGSTRGIPIEVIPFGWSRVVRDLTAFGLLKFCYVGRPGAFRDRSGELHLRLRDRTDRRSSISACASQGLPGVVETGLFLG